MEELHVLPVNDLRPHTDVGTHCKCNPRIEHERGSIIVVHNAWDGREFDEAAERMERGH